MDTLTSLRVFCAVAELKSFTAAADRLDLSPAMASKHVMHLEGRLSTRLLNRSSRHVSLTENGALYFSHAKQMLDGLDEIESAVSNVTVTPRGTLRLSAPVWSANPFFARLLTDYRERYPDVSFDIDLSGRKVNLVEEGIDVALRMTSQESLDPGLIARPLTPVPFHIVAAPSYLDRTGRPKRFSDLNGHALLMYNGTRSLNPLTWNGPDGAETARFKIAIESGNETMLHFAALEGAGLVFLPEWICAPDIAEGRLERVLPDVVPLVGAVFALYPSRKYLSAKVRTFIDFLVARTSQAVAAEQAG